jgi:hypothetical protein
MVNVFDIILQLLIAHCGGFISGKGTKEQLHLVSVSFYTVYTLYIII